MTRHSRLGSARVRAGAFGGMRSRMPAILTALLVTSISVLAIASTANASPIHPALSIPSLEGTFDRPCGVATDSAGDIYVANKKISLGDESSIKIYDASGTFITQIIPPPFEGFCDLAVDGSGSIYFVQGSGTEGSGAIVKYVPKLGVFPPVPGTEYEPDKTTVNSAIGVIVRKGANSVATNPVNGSIVASLVPTTENQTLTFTGAKTTGQTFTLTCDGETTAPISYSTSAGTLRTNIKNALVAKCGAGNFTIENNPPTIAFEGKYFQQNVPTTICAPVTGTTTCSVTSQFDGGPDRISSYQSNGTPIPSGTMGSGVSGAVYVGVGAYGANGNVYAADITHNKVIVFNSAGSILKEITGADSPTGAFTGMEKPMLAVDQSNGNVLVSDIKGHEVVDEFNATGNYVTQITHSPAFVEAGPSGIAVDNSSGASKGNVYVSSGTTGGSVFSYGALEPKKTLGTTVSPGGSGEVRCNGGACALEYAEESSITLEGKPNPGFKFKEWTGGTGSAAVCNGSTSACTFTFTANSTVTAVFELAGFELKVVKSGAGSARLPRVLPASTAEGTARRSFQKARS